MAYQSAEEVEVAFYAAFAACDVEAMARLWAQEDVICTHPGAVPLLGHDAVMRSWEHIFSGALEPSIEVHPIRRIVGKDLAVHIVEEKIATPEDPSAAAIVMATNIYRRSEAGWSMVSHQGVLMTGASRSGRTLQ